MNLRPVKIRFVPIVLCVVAASALWTPIARAADGGTNPLEKFTTVKKLEALKPGAKAPDFRLRDLEGREFHLAASARRNAILLFFWSFFCGPCREEIPMINQLTRDYRGRSLRVVGVNLDGRKMEQSIGKFAAEEKIAFRIVIDEQAGDSFRVADPYGVPGTPALFLVDRRGIVSFSQVGAVTEGQLKAAIGKVVK